MGAGENITKQRLEDVDFETIDKVIHRVKRTMATNLENWSLENQDLYTDGSE